jgi:transcriptional regulator with XRE-family HTH domain
MVRIKRFRLAKKLTQEKLAELIGINRVTIARYETGRATPGLATADKLAKALDCTIEELLEEKEEATNE